MVLDTSEYSDEELEQELARRKKAKREQKKYIRTVAPLGPEQLRFVDDPSGKEKHGSRRDRPVEKTNKVTKEQELREGDRAKMEDNPITVFWNRLRFVIGEHKYLILAIYIAVWFFCVMCEGILFDTFKIFMNENVDKNHGWFYYGATNWSPYIIAFLAVIVYIIWRMTKGRSSFDTTRNFEYSDSDVAGSAYFMSEKEIAQNFDITKVEDTDQQFFGYMLNDEGGITDMVLAAKKDKFINGHTFICGGSGTRKTTTFLLNMALQAIRRGESIICTDPKGELYGILKNLCERNGYEVYQYNMNKPFNSDGIDFLEELRDEDLTQMMINVQILAGTIMQNTSGLKAGEGPGNYWYDNAEAVITGALYYELMKKRNKNTPKATFKDVYADFQLGAEGFGSLFADLPDSHPAKKVMAPYLDSLAHGKKENCASILSGVTSRLKIFANPDILEMVSNHDMDFTRPGYKKCAYFVMAPDQHNTMTFMNATYFSLMFIKLAGSADANDDPGQRRALPIRVNFLLDEFKSVGRIDGFQDKLANIRSRNISLTIVMQNIPQLMTMYPGVSWEDALSNFDVNIYIGGNDSQSTADYYAKRLGKATAVMHQERHNENIGTPVMNRLRPSRAVSDSLTARELMSPDEIVADLSLDEALLFIKQTRAIKIGKLDYRRHPMAPQIVEINASHHVPVWVRNALGYPLKTGDMVINGCPLDASDEKIYAVHNAIKLIWRKTGIKYSYREYIEAQIEDTLPDVTKDDDDVVNIYEFVDDNGKVKSEALRSSDYVSNGPDTDSSDTGKNSNGSSYGNAGTTKADSKNSLNPKLSAALEEDLKKNENTGKGILDNYRSKMQATTQEPTEETSRRSKLQKALMNDKKTDSRTEAPDQDDDDGEGEDDGTTFADKPKQEKEDNPPEKKIQSDRLRNKTKSKMPAGF